MIMLMKSLGSCASFWLQLVFFIFLPLIVVFGSLCAAGTLAGGFVVMCCECFCNSDNWVCFCLAQVVIFFLCELPIAVVIFAVSFAFIFPFGLILAYLSFTLMVLRQLCCMSNMCRCRRSRRKKKKTVQKKPERDYIEWA